MNVVIQPGTARGSVAAPPSKSMAHRLLICAALAEGESLVRGVDPSQDILATADCLTALGASLTWEGDAIRVRGCDPRKAASAVLRCRESGSTLRFMIPLCLLSGQAMRLEGSETLLSRPLSVYEDLCRDQGLLLEYAEGGLRVQGCLTAGEYTVSGSISSQFISGLLFALPLLPGNSRIRLLPPVESRSYLDLTLQALRDAGVPVSWSDEYTLEIPGNSRFHAGETVVEGDYSNAAFFEAFNCAGGSVAVTGLRPDSLQGDRVYRDFFPLLAKGPAELDLTDCPDLAPVLFVTAALCHGAVFTGTRRLRFKEVRRHPERGGESDRRSRRRSPCSVRIARQPQRSPDRHGLVPAVRPHRRRDPRCRSSAQKLPGLLGPSPFFRNQCIRSERLILNGKEFILWLFFKRSRKPANSSEKTSLPCPTACPWTRSRKAARSAACRSPNAILMPRAA